MEAVQGCVNYRGLRARKFEWHAIMSGLSSEKTRLKTVPMLASFCLLTLTHSFIASLEVRA